MLIQPGLMVQNFVQGIFLIRYVLMNMILFPYQISFYVPQRKY